MVSVAVMSQIVFIQNLSLQIYVNQLFQMVLSLYRIHLYLLYMLYFLVLLPATGFILSLDNGRKIVIPNKDVLKSGKNGGPFFFFELLLIFGS